jgi:hypothetical protein
MGFVAVGIGYVGITKTHLMKVSEVVFSVVKR